MGIDSFFPMGQEAFVSSVFILFAELTSTLPAMKLNIFQFGGIFFLIPEKIILLI